MGDSLLEVRFMSPDEEVTYGRAYMPHMPRIGEVVWIQNNRMGFGGTGIIAGRVVDVVYWCPNRDAGYNRAWCTSGVAYIEEIEHIGPGSADED